LFELFKAVAQPSFYRSHHDPCADLDMTDRVEQLYERVLVLRGQTGDEDAFAELVERYSPRLRYYLRRMLEYGDPDDVLQDIWLDVFRGLPRLADVAAFPAWLYRLARDRVVRTHRRRRFHQSIHDLDPPDESGDETFTAEDAERIHLALGKLAPEHREVLVLRFVEEMSYEGIAEVIGSPLGTVRSRLHYAKQALRGILEREQRHG
jgi:RNA polymerase sigma-70 factor (ECF subfamily)